MKSRMKGDFHVRFRENVGVKFPCVTRLVATAEKELYSNAIFKIKNYMKSY